MNKLKKLLKRSGMFVAAAIMLGGSIPAIASQQTGTNQPQQNQSTDSQLKSNIRHALVMLPYYTVFDILGFKLQDDGTVILTGQVVWATVKDDAEHVVKKIDGVTKVINDIEILPVWPHDNTIRRREFYAIYSQMGFERYAIQAVPPIHILVNKGHVTLEGVVDDQYDKNLAGLAANGVPNVFQVTNNLQIRQ